MTHSKRTISAFLISTVISLFFSCTNYPYNRKNPYPTMETVRYAGSQAYIFPNENSDNLIIVIEGIGWQSVLGEKENKIWATGLTLLFLQKLNASHTFLIPEKLNRQPGMAYREDMEDRANYTAENLLNCYVESINGYLADHVFSSIVLIGFSEGAILLPLLYEKMDNKDKVTAMVSISHGGLSYSESFKILSSRPDLSFGNYFNLSYIFDPENKPENEELLNSFEKNFYGFTLRYFNSFSAIRPFDYYKNIDIPILFVHGKADQFVAVESTEYIQENLPDKPFEYTYYEWDYWPENWAQSFKFRKDITEWIEKNG